MRKNKNTNDDFETYWNPKTKLIQVEGFEKMGKDIDIDIYNDLYLLIFMFKCNAKKNDCLTRDEFNLGLKNLSIKKFINLKRSKNDLKKKYLYNGSPSKDNKDFFIYLFTVNLNTKTKKIDFECTQLYFTMYFLKSLPLVNKFLEFIKTQKKEYKLNKDEWISFYDFIVQLGNTFPQGYDLGTAWTVILDEFYIQYCKSQNIPLPEGYTEEEI